MLEITSKMHKLQAKIMPDCLFKCIFSIILKLSLHFKIISMPIYSELQIKAPDHNAFAANIVINFLHLDGARTYFFLRQNMKTCANGAMAQPGLNTVYWTQNINVLFPISSPICHRVSRSATFFSLSFLSLFV